MPGLKITSELDPQRVEDGPALQKQFDDGPHLQRDAMAIFLSRSM